MSRIYFCCPYRVLATNRYETGETLMINKGNLISIFFVPFKQHIL